MGLGSFISGIGGGGLLGAGLGFALGGPFGAVMGYGLGSGIDGYYNNRANMNYQDYYNLKYWNMQNAYNHPAAQMQRFREAGLNPNLIYSQQNLAGSVGSVDSRLQSPDLMGMLGQYYNIRNLEAQNNNIVQQNENLKEQARALRIDNNLRENAGPFADAPWYWRFLVRSLPKEWKKPDGNLDLGRLDKSALSNILLGALSGFGSVFNPVHNVGAVFGSGINPENLPPVSRMFVRGDRGY